MGETCHRARQVCLIGSEPCGCGECIAALLELLEERAGAALLGDLDHIALMDECGGDVDALAVHREVTVADELTCLTARVGKAEAEHDVVHAALEEAEEVFTGDAGHLLCLLIVAAELPLKDTVDELCLLLFLELKSVLGDLAVRAAELTRRLARTTEGRRLEAEGTAAL